MRVDETVASVRVLVDDSKFWNWCAKTLTTGTWMMTMGLAGTASTYRFMNAEDATAFRLMFDL